jgi:aryl-alcohol dehydrogenase-like predicted oxidoreductase
MYLQIHGWDNAVPPEEWLEALGDLVRAGKVRYIGVCNLCGWQMQKVVDLCKSGRYPPVVSLQVSLTGTRQSSVYR